MTPHAMNQKALRLFNELGRNPTVVDLRDWGPLDRKLPGELLLPRRHPAECGTTSGYRNHTRNGETPCQGCADAHRIYNNQRRQAAS